MSRTIRTIAWICLALGFTVLAAAAQLVGGALTTVWLIWLGFWALVGFLAQLDAGEYS